MASNTLLTTSMITKEALMLLENELAFSKHVNREYDKSFAVAGGKIGSALNIRKPVAYNVTSGPNLSIQNTIESTVPLVITNQDHVDMEFTSAELALSMDEFSDRILKPAISALANKIDFNGLQLVAQVPNTVGSPTALADTLKTYLGAGVRLDNESAPRNDRAVVVSPSAQAGLVDNLKGLFQSATEISEQYKKGTMGIAAGFKFSMDQNVPTHVNGTGTANPVVINGASQSGSTLVVSGLTGTLKKGDTFTIAGVNSVNTKSKQDTGQLRQFVALADVAAAGTSINISPALVATGPYQNVTALPANGAALTFIGAASAAYEYGVAFCKDAFTLACVDLPLPGGTDRAARMSDSQLGLSLRIVSQYMIATDTFATRIDILYGWALIRPELAVKIINDPTKLT